MSKEDLEKRIKAVENTLNAIATCRITLEELEKELCRGVLNPLFGELEKYQRKIPRVEVVTEEEIMQDLQK